MHEYELSTKFDVFISYSREDDSEKPFVQRLEKDLKKKSVYLDVNDMQSRGRSFLVELRNAIFNSERLIAVITPRALRSIYVLQEWSYAYHFSKAIIPILRQGSIYDIFDDQKAILCRDEFDQIFDPLDIDVIKNLHIIDFTDDNSYEKSLKELNHKLSSDLIPLASIYNDVRSFPPPNFLPRNSILKKLAELRLIDPRDPRSFMREMRVMIIHGDGGTGKTVLINAIAHSFQIRRVYTDGIFWLEIGKSDTQANNLERPHVFSALKFLGAQIKQNVDKYYDHVSAKLQLKEYFSSKQCLIILDNVFDSRDVQDFIDIIGNACAIYITTRNKGIEAELGISQENVVLLGGDDLRFDREESLQLLADWSGTPPDTLPPEAEKIVEICNGLPLAISICGAIIRKNFPWTELPRALLESREEITETILPPYSPNSINVFTPIKVSLEHLQSLDEKRKREGNTSTSLVEQYLDLSVLRGGIRTPEDLIFTLWSELRNTDTMTASKTLSEFDSWALLRLVGNNQPNAFILLHELQRAYINKISAQSDKELLRWQFGIALFKKWKTAIEKAQNRKSKNLEYEKNYCKKYLFQDLINGECWNEIEQLLNDPKYLVSKQDKEGQYSMEEDIADLLTYKHAPIEKILSAALTGILNDIIPRRHQADWLDTFAYWLNKHGKKGDKWLSDDIQSIAIEFDNKCGEISKQVANEFLISKKQNYALRYAELCAWAYQRCGNLDGWINACTEAENICTNESLEIGYQTLGKLEFMRMRCQAISQKEKKEPSSHKHSIDQLYNTLSTEFSKITPLHWPLTKDEWRLFETDNSQGFLLRDHHMEQRGSDHEALVVSNTFDALGALYLIQILESEGSKTKWLHHDEFNKENSFNRNTKLVILIGGPKAPGISELADNFFQADRNNYLRMYSGLYLEPHLLKTVINGTSCYMLGGISKMHTLLAIYIFAKNNI